MPTPHSYQTASVMTHRAAWTCRSSATPDEQQRPYDISRLCRQSGNTASMRAAAWIAALILTPLIGLALFGLWMLEAIVRGGTCGPAEGGGSCAAGLLSWALLGGAVVALGATIVLVMLRRRR